MCKIRGVGVDLCSISRMAEAMEKEHFLRRCFTEAEIAHVRSRGAAGKDTLAGLFAAKEAVCKALGTGITFALTDIEITHTAAGQPQVRLSGPAEEAAGGGVIHLSITHEGDMAAAFAVWEA